MTKGREPIIWRQVCNLEVEMYILYVNTYTYTDLGGIRGGRRGLMVPVLYDCLYLLQHLQTKRALVSLNVSPQSTYETRDAVHIIHIHFSPSFIGFSIIAGVQFFFPL